MSRGTWERARGSQHTFVYRTITVCGQPSQAVRLASWFLTPRLCCPESKHAPRHRRRNAGRLDAPLGLGCSRFARRYSGNRVCFLFLGVLRCFTSPRSLPDTMYSCRDDTVLPVPGFPIRKSAGLGLFAALRSLSQLITSFIAF